MKRDFLRNAFASAALIVALAAPIAAQAGGVPQLPSSPQYSEGSQIVPTLNVLIQQLNGVASPNGGYATQPGNVISLGQYCTASGATPQTCNGQRGQAVTNSLSTAASSAANYVLNDSSITAANVCRANVVAYSGTFHTNGQPYIATVTPGTGTLTFSIANGDATNALSGTVTFTFDCVN